MKIRMHRGGLSDSMATMKECPTIKHLVEYLEANGVDPESVICESYDYESDPRIGWKETFIITGRHKDWVKGDKKYPLAFCDEYFTMDL